MQLETANQNDDDDDNSHEVCDGDLQSLIPAKSNSNEKHNISHVEKNLELLITEQSDDDMHGISDGEKFIANYSTKWW
ncbi:hypothetical protein CEXT_296541 [Caerostris extrusa]|uniref:Uncharacterized protein n=1 Tax=Caerostris extrusa TaxID=172846 RepID=A0AAV4T4D4_CAEEX|nr:hypothetical protein CEXT_296541 [Caerostris extrusa]